MRSTCSRATSSSPGPRADPRCRLPRRRARDGVLRGLPARGGPARPRRGPQVVDPLYDEAALAELGLPAWDGAPIDGAILQADHAEYRGLRPEQVPGARTVIDGRGSLDAQALGNAGDPRAPHRRRLTARRVRARTGRTREGAQGTGGPLVRNHARNTHTNANKSAPAGGEPAATATVCACSRGRRPGPGAPPQAPIVGTRPPRSPLWPRRPSDQPRCHAQLHPLCTSL